MLKCDTTLLPRAMTTLLGMPSGLLVLTALVSSRSRTRDSIAWTTSAEQHTEIHLRAPAPATADWAKMAESIRARFEQKHRHRAVTQVHLYAGHVSLRAPRDASEIREVARVRRESLVFASPRYDEAARATVRINIRQ